MSPLIGLIVGGVVLLLAVQGGRLVRVALTSRADTDLEIFRPGAHGGRIDRRAALRTEGLLAFGAALGRFHIDYRFAR